MVTLTTSVSSDMAHPNTVFEIGRAPRVTIACRPFTHAVHADVVRAPANQAMSDVCQC
jgi:hypothetical protein